MPPLRLRKLLSSFFLVFTIAVALAQQPVRLPIEGCKALYADSAGNAYIVTPSLLYCYHTSTHTLDSMALLYRHATPVVVDTRMPDSVLVFYPVEGVVQYVSAQLRTLGEPRQLRQQGMENVSLICTSQNGGYWVYDYAHDRLTHTSADNTVQPIRELFLTIGKATFEPCFMQEHNGRLYLNNFEDGVLVFSQEGICVETIPLKGLQTLQLWGEHLYYTLLDQPYAYNLNTKENLALPVLLPRSWQSVYAATAVLVLDKDEHVWKVEQK